MISLDARHYPKIIDAMNLLKILAIGENDIRSGRAYSHEKVDSDIKALLEEV